VVSTLTVGDHDITATYSGACIAAGQIAPGTSDPVTQVVAAAYPLAVDAPVALPVVADRPITPDDEGTSMLPAAVVAGSGLAVAAIVYGRSRPQPEDA